MTDSPGAPTAPVDPPPDDTPDDPSVIFTPADPVPAEED